MPQHDLDVANSNGAGFRSDLNGALVALGSTMKGPTPPPSPIAGMAWLEDDSPTTTRWSLRFYDGAGWVYAGEIDTSNDRFIPAGLFQLGAAATPGFAPAGDPDTGMWSPGANVLAWSTSGAERFRVGATGLFSIGTTSAAGLLHVANTLQNSLIAQVRIENANPSGSFAELMLHDGRGSTDLKRQVFRNVQGELLIGTVNDLETVFTERWRMNATGAIRHGNPAHLMRSDERFSIVGPLGAKAGANNTPSLVVGTQDNTFLAEFFNSATASIGSITAAGGGTGVSFNTTSDERLKEVKAGARPDIDALWAALRPEIVTRIDAPEAVPHLAFLAQRVAAAVPDAVTVGSEAGPGDPGFEPWAVDYGRLTPAIMALLISLADRVAVLERYLAPGPSLGGLTDVSLDPAPRAREG
ncbi:hypothetical protein [Falsiroseomonas sp.]|uniref:hypothetical protein n=1 Tax=Falsiroseomonas sp. TaxID=2870721 RepID=UPI003F6EEED8